jgi:hypothetical protein
VSWINPEEYDPEPKVFRPWPYEPLELLGFPELKVTGEQQELQARRAPSLRRRFIQH